MNNTTCVQAETLAGAVALGEAGDDERDAYRRHLIACRSCLAELGGEREIERTMRLVALARDAERWEPGARDLFARRRASVRFGRWAALAGAAAVAVFGLFVTHGRAPVTTPVRQAAQRPAPAQVSRAVAALGTQSGPRLENRADLLALGPAIAGAGGAAGTTAFTVRVDAGGRPLSCTVGKSSGSRALDDAVCRAAMRGRYAPRMVNGRATAGAYRGAVTIGSGGSR